MGKYLDDNGLLYFWGKIKSYIANAISNSGFYTKPSGGIPKSDLTEGVQTSLGKADTAIQTETDPIYSASPASGITTTDINNWNSATQNKADKVTNATANNLAALDANGNLIDSGVSATSAGTDTKNTTGSTADAAKLYIVGAKELSANPVTYSQANAYITAGKVYSNAKEVVNLSDTQALSNKTYNNVYLNNATSALDPDISMNSGVISVVEGKRLKVTNSYTLGDACAKSVDSSITAGSTSVNVPTTAAVESRITSAIAEALVGAATFQGSVTSNTDITSLVDYRKGYYWVVATAGTYVGETCEVGDFIFCVNDKSTSYSASDFKVLQTNLSLETITNSEIDTITAS